MFFQLFPLRFTKKNILVLTLRAFMIRRAQFNQFVSSTPSLTMNRYFRLMSLAMTEILFTIPIATYGLYLNITSRPIYPWKSWSDIHFDWYTIDTYPASYLRFNQTALITLELSRWTVVFCAFTFFAFFGFADEARRNYKRIFMEVTQRFGSFDGSALAAEKARFRLGIKELVVPSTKGDADTDTLSTLPTYTLRKSEHYTLSPKRDSCFSINMSQKGTHCGSDASETVYGCPQTQVALEGDPTIWRTTAENPSALSRYTI